MHMHFGSFGGSLVMAPYLVMASGDELLDGLCWYGHELFDINVTYHVCLMGMLLYIMKDLLYCGPK